LEKNMSRAKGARLYLKQLKGRSAVYVIRGIPKEVSTGCGPGDVEGANRALAAHLAKHFKPDTRQRDLAAISIPEVLTLFMSQISSDSPSRATRGYQVKALLPFWGDKSLADVKGSKCRDYVNKRKASTATARLELKTLQAAINVWHRESALPAVPQVTLPPAAAPRERVLERKEAAALLRACRVKRGHSDMPKMDGYHVSRIIRLGLATGTRISAILALRWLPSMIGGHIDVENGILYRRGASERETSKRRPPARLNAKTLAMVRRWRAMDDQSATSSVITYNGHRPKNARKAFASIVNLAGLGKDVTPHTLKHTHITWRLRSGEQPWHISGDVGTDAATIEKVYGHHQTVIPAERKSA
jgi:integrase